MIDAWRPFWLCVCTSSSLPAFDFPIILLLHNSCVNFIQHPISLSSLIIPLIAAGPYWKDSEKPMLPRVRRKQLKIRLLRCHARFQESVAAILLPPGATIKRKRPALHFI